MCDVLVVDGNARSYGAALDTQCDPQERIMTTHPTIVHEVADPRWEVVPAEAADDRHGNDWHSANDLMLVLGVAAVVLGMVIVSQGVLPAQPAAHRVPSAHAALMPTERALPAPEERLTAYASPTTSVPPTRAPRTASSGATGLVVACTPRLDLDHDLRLVLLAMALQRRRTLHPTAHFVPPDKQDIPASVLARTKGVVTRAEASPQATWGPNGPSC
jgi:hypothetical protein